MEITEILDKQMLSIKISKRKKPISLEVYERPTKTLFERIEKRDIFAHMFLVLDCCLMKRAENCVNAKIITFIFTVNDSSLSLQSLRATER